MMKVRPAKPEDAGFLAWVIQAAGRGHVRRGIWDVVLGRSDEECLAFFQRLVVTGRPHPFHHSLYLLSEMDGRAAAALGGYDPLSQGFEVLREALPELYKALGWVMSPLSERAKEVMACIPEAVEGAWVIDSVATLPEFRRRGLVDGLLEEIMAQGRRLGFGKAQINIYLGNTPAQRAYEKHGFRILDEIRAAAFEREIGSAGMARLVREL